MKAAVVHAFDQAPRYSEFPLPTARTGEAIVTMRAAALSQLTRAIASGKHYSAGGQLPMVPGFDGVGVLPDGKRVYFAFPSGMHGSMAEQSVVARANCIAVPEGVDDAAAAAIANPGMSSWAALVERARFRPGESVLVNGATGTSGRLAVQIARYLGAKRVVATGRNRTVLAEVGADAVVELDQEPEDLVAALREQVAVGVDVVLDYLWGTPAERLITALGGHGGAGADRRIRYVQIGSMAGQTINMPAAPLRSTALELMGSGLGSVSREGLLKSIGGVFEALAAGKVSIAYDAKPLAEVESAWAAKGADRVVFTM